MSREERRFFNESRRLALAALLLGNGGLEGSASRELRQRRGRDLDRGAGGRIAAFTSSTLGSLKRTKTDQLEAVTLGDRLHDSVKDGVDDAASLSLRKFVFFGDDGDEFLLVHWNSPKKMSIRTMNIPNILHLIPLKPEGCDGKTLIYGVFI